MVQRSRPKPEQEDFQKMQHPRKTARRLAAIAFSIAAALSASTVRAGLMDESLFGPSNEERIAEWSKAPEKKLRWGDWDSLQLVARDGGSKSNSHPVVLDPALLAKALSSIEGKPFKDTKPVFSQAEVKRFVPAIVAALAKASPDQELVFVSTGQHAWTGLVAPVLGNAGRIFYADGKLNLIFGMLHSDFPLAQGNRDGGSVATRPDVKINFGSRAAASKDVLIVGVKEGEAQLLRSDWIAVSIGAGAATAAVSPSTAKPAAPAASDPGTDAFYSKQEGRLKALQRLRDQGLITDAEFQAKRAQIIKDL